MNKNRHKYKLSDAPKNFWAIMLLFMLINSIAVYFEFYFLLPLAFLPLIAYYSFFEFDKLYFFVVFTTPISIGLQLLFPEIAFNLSIPSEFLLILMLLLISFKLISGGLFEKKIFSHPISIAIIIYLTWMFITSISSSMPLVSFKHLLAQLWFIFPLYFLPVLLFRNQKNIFWFLGLYILPLTVVIFYSINKHMAFGLFDKNASNFVMKPFYNDHTSYGAIIAMYIPVLTGLIFSKRIKFPVKYLIVFLSILFIIALILSYTRAAWISVLGAALLAVLILLKIKIRYVSAIVLIIISILFVYRIEIIDKLSKNKQDSSAKLSAHIKSVSNIATDASNRERINRWNAALAMFYERPVLGWGPGTYMFQYAPFQKARDKTIISTNFAEGGNAHSEYIGPLAEQGIIGFLCFTGIIVSFMASALKLYFKTHDKEVKLLILISLLSISTYIIHGLLNNFLDTDKAAVPFWGFLAIITSFDLYRDTKNPQLGGAEER